MKFVLNSIVLGFTFIGVAQENFNLEEVFSDINERMSETSVSTNTRFEISYAALEKAAMENPDQYGLVLESVNKFKVLTNNFEEELGALKQELVQGIKDPTDYAAMDKSSFVDSLFFQGDKPSKKGKTFLKTIHSFKEAAMLLCENHSEFKKELSKKFSTEDVLDRNGNVKNWLEFNYKGFPLIAVITRLTSFQGDARYSLQEFINISYSE